jgi:Tol biopolymer transport system component
MSYLAITLLAALPLFSFGQSAPILDSTAKVSPFAPGVVSTRYDEGANCFSSDGKTVYFTMGSAFSTICCSNNVDGKWIRPEVASFSGRWNDQDAFVSPDGKWLVYSSDRPLPGTSVPNNHSDLWYVNKVNGKWGEPQHLDSVINSGANNYAPSISADGTLYWCSPNRPGYKGKGMQGYSATWLGNHYGTAQIITIEGINHVQDPFIAANGKYLVFLSGRDICVSMRGENGWAKAIKLGTPVSLGDYIGAPNVSRDGKTLYFTTARKKGFYKRDPNAPAITYDELLKENNSLFNGKGNILMVPVNLPDGN